MVRELAVTHHSYDPYPAIDGEHFAVKLEKALFRYDWEIAQVQLNLLDSHDTARLLSIAGEDKATVRLATILLMTVPGAPSVYYGDEIGLAGKDDPDCRRTINWDKRDSWDMETLAYTKQLINLRKAHPALRRGAFKTLHAGALSYAFSRAKDNDKLIIVLNVGDRAQKLDIPVKGLVEDGVMLKAVYGKGSVMVEGGMAKVTVPARDGVILAAAI